MKYMLLMNYGAADFDGISLSQEEMAEGVDFMNRLNERLKAAGEWIDGQGLGLPKDARTVRYVDNTVVATDGPYGEAKEVLAGFWLLECSAARAEAVAAEVVAYTRGAIEVREVQDAPPGTAEGTGT